MPHDFHGAKVALFFANRVLVYQCDNKTDIPYPGQWDLPGGGREGGESPVECALREIEEEFGLALSQASLHWFRQYPSGRVGGASTFFMVGVLSPEECAAIRFGDEGQQWRFMETDEFLSHPNAVPHLQRRLHDYLHEAGSG